MTQADYQFQETCRRILKDGISSEGTDVRTHWEDGTPAHYISLIGIVNKYDLSEEFPMITLRDNSKTVYRAIDEILWIWQRKSNSIRDLNLHIWDQWADKDGSIGRAYGYQLAKKCWYKTKDGNEYMDQVDYVRYLISNDPASRRIMTNIFVHEDLRLMNLEPCAYGTQWLVKKGKLHLILNQRSQDMLTANGWNVMQYAALLMMFAKEAGLEPGTLTHCIGDCHIYDRHIPMVKELIYADSAECRPKLIINDEKKSFYDYTVDDFYVENYAYNHSVNIGRIPVAI